MNIGVQNLRGSVSYYTIPYYIIPYYTVLYHTLLYFLDPPRGLDGGLGYGTAAQKAALRICRRQLFRWIYSNSLNKHPNHGPIFLNIAITASTSSIPHIGMGNFLRPMQNPRPLAADPKSKSTLGLPWAMRDYGAPYHAPSEPNIAGLVRALLGSRPI